MNCRVRFNCAVNGRIFALRSMSIPFLRAKSVFDHNFPSDIPSFRLVPESLKAVGRCCCNPTIVRANDAGYSRCAPKRFLVLGSGLAFGTLAFLNHEEGYAQTLPLDDSHESENSSECSLSVVSPYSRTAEEVLYKNLPQMVSKVLTVQNAIFFWKMALKAAFEIMQTARRAADSFTKIFTSAFITSRPVQTFAAVITAANLAMEDIKFKIMKLKFTYLQCSQVTPAAQQLPQPQFHGISDDYGTFPPNVSEDLVKPEAGAVDGAVHAPNSNAANTWPGNRMAAGAVMLSFAIVISVVLKRNAAAFVPKVVKAR